MMYNKPMLSEWKILKAAKCPNEELSLTNCAIVHPTEFSLEKDRHVEIQTSPREKFVFSLKTSEKVPKGFIGFNVAQRKWGIISINQELEVKTYRFDPNNQYVSKLVLQVDFLMKKNTTLDPYDTEKMAAEFVAQFPKQAFTKGQIIVFQFSDKKILELVVKEMEGKFYLAITTNVGLVLPNTVAVFEKADNSSINLVGKAKDWDFQKMGIGGLDNEFSAIFRRAFASRVFPPEIVAQLGCKHVRGILLFGPPGTGKTLMARQIGNMLNAKEPKIVNGPQILDKYVGESEANIRKLFADAEEEEKRLGPNSGLHIIIFDEIDAICKSRGSVSGNTGVHDTVVNQLLSKIDGVDQLNNILVIGMTNRRDMIDEALLRPGRLEVMMEIGLPDEHGRGQILNIHTTNMRQNDKLADDVDMKELAALTRNFSGAEIEGLVRAAISSAMNRLIKASSKVEIDPEAQLKLRVTRDDFLHALEEEEIEKYMLQGIIPWGAPIHSIIEDGELFIQQARSPDSQGIFVLTFFAGSPNSGKTALAAMLAKKSEFPFVKICSPEDMIGYTESAKCMAIKKLFDDAYKSPLSCIVVDNIERLLDYGPIGPRYSNLVLQALLVLMKKDPPKVFHVKAVLDEMEMVSAFTASIHVYNISDPEQLVNVLEETNCFARKQIEEIARKVKGRRLWIPIKKLLAYIDMARQTDDNHRVIKFLTKLEDEEALSDQ
ncbi:Vesicle-fusing ATPase 1 [Nymphon striatum]|nr:Vesicle-fusing ATPase 1 [Nymphon striatum]